MQVDFMIIGAQKCGTTTLFKILDSHPSLVGSRHKESNYFSLSNDWRNDLPRYEKLFKLKEGALYFEGSTTYTFYPGGCFQNAWERKYPIRNLRIWDDIFDYNPKMKLIYLVRNPIDRIVSSYMHHYRRGYTDLNIEESIRKERFLIDVTRYHTQIYPYIRKFGSNNVRIIDFDDLMQSRVIVLQEISKFLAIDFKKFSNYENIHFSVSIGSSDKHHKFDRPSLPLKVIRKFLPSVWNKVTDNSKRSFRKKPILTFEIKEMIINMLELEVRELQGLMNKDLSKWMSLEK